MEELNWFNHIPEGTRITCPKCSSHLLTAAKTIYTGEALVEEMFEPNDYYRNGVACICRECKTSFTEPTCCGAFKLHTEWGWFPPELEKSSPTDVP